jgi:hypothetical protein
LVNVWVFHTICFEGDAGPLLTLGVVELGVEFLLELGPHQGDVVCYRVEVVNPLTHVASPARYFWALYECEGECDLADGGLESRDSDVGSKVAFDFFEEVLGFVSISREDPWGRAHGSYIGGRGHRGLRGVLGRCSWSSSSGRVWSS